MSTNSIIAKRNKNESIEAVYCHWDGYIENNGKILLNHYTDQKKIDQLIALGSISSLGALIGKKHDFMNREDDVCTAYHRDRGEELEIMRFKKKPDETATQQLLKLTKDFSYVYLWNEVPNTWVVFIKGSKLKIKVAFKCNTKVYLLSDAVREVERLIELDKAKELQEKKQ